MEVNFSSLVMMATGLEKVSFHFNPKESQCQRILKLLHNCIHLTHTSKVILKILQARLQHYMSCELPDIQAGFRKGRGTRDQIANILWITDKAREFQKNIYFCFIDYAKAFDCVDHHNLEISETDGNTRPHTSREICMQVKRQQLELTWNNRLVPNRERSTSGLYIVILLI